jgi:threonine/homoserine/homoserine lactone efflux protein
VTGIPYPDPDQYRPYTPPATSTSRRGQVRHVAGIVLTVAVVLGATYLFVRALGTPPEWLKWAGLALVLGWWRYTSWRDRRRERQQHREPTP